MQSLLHCWVSGPVFIMLKFIPLLKKLSQRGQVVFGESGAAVSHKKVSRRNRRSFGRIWNFHFIMDFKMRKDNHLYRSVRMPIVDFLMNTDPGDCMLMI